jgi:hypothetical protein
MLKVDPASPLSLNPYLARNGGHPAARGREAKPLSLDGSLTLGKRKVLTKK